MSVEYYKKALKREQQKTKYAWGQYFQMRNELFDNQVGIYDEIEITPIDPDMDEHLQRFINELYEKAKAYVNCAICLEKITSDTLETTPCGHNFHKQCMSELKKYSKELGSKTVPCPNCRKDLWIK